MSTMIEWLDEEVIPKIIERIEKSGRKFKRNWAELENFHFSSQVFLLELIFKEDEKNEEETFHLILKCPSVPHELSWKLLDNGMYANEILFYEKFARNSPTYPRYIYGTADDPDKTVVIMENVSKRGFKMCPQPYDVPFKYVIHAVREIGRFHGAGYVMKAKYPKEFREMISQIKLCRYVRGSRYEILIETVALRPLEWLRKINYDSVFCDKMEKYFGDAFNNIILNGMRPIEPLAVLIHGDFTRSNMLFKETSDKVETMLIDFGTICYASPGIDLSTFLFLNASSEDRRNRFDEIFAAYHESLLGYLRDAGVVDLENYSIESMLNDYRSRATFGYITALHFLPVLRGYCHHDDDDCKPSRGREDIVAASGRVKVGGGDGMSKEFADMLLELRNTGCLDHVLEEIK
uniref:TP53RK protein n=1 Tax=Fopius arisanus TaxID=64838 RepID=A0A0C9Q679_9HYME